ncbi:potassium channel family protein [Metabacillus fastidiosus]|uniref:potassium channel family protein n=1 Tax=Metabacillus fastidiosus TaxID=1458 RepID=UPI002E1A643C|nr:potassium channel family protein [Metabacillus fastidiosus]
MLKSNKLYIRWMKSPLYIRIMLVVLFIIIFFGWIVALIEPKEFPTAFDGIWWALVTISTVGFGDLAPETVAGRLIGMMLIFIGASFITAFFATLSAAAIKKQYSYAEGNVAFKEKQHVIIIGWNEKASEIIQSVRQIEPFKKIVLIDNTLEEAPLIENVHFIRGNPINDQTLLRANLTEADAAIITADQHKNELEADMQSILILLALKGLNKELYSVIEILTEHQVNNAERAGADEIIKSYQLTSHFIISSYLARNKLSSIYADLNPASGNLFQLLNVPVQLIGVTFKKASHELLEKETILIGIKRGEKTIMNPPLSMIIETDDLLIIFAH